MFASLVRDLRAITSQDTHLDNLMKDFEESVRDLRIDCSDRRIKTSIQKQVNLLEALGRVHPGVKCKTLGAISKQLKNWPHKEVIYALQSLYRFTCDYPWIRHGGTPTSVVAASRADEARRPPQPLQVIHAVRIGAEPGLELAHGPRIVRASTRAIHRSSFYRSG